MKAPDYIRLVLAAAVAGLGVAVFLLVQELAAWRGQVPQVLDASERWYATAGELQPEVTRAIDAAEKATAEVAAVRGELPVIIATVDRTRVTAEAAMRRVDTLQQDLPAVLKRVDGVVVEARRANDQVPAVLVEVDRINDMVPALLAESGAIRREAPQLLDDADALLDKAATVSQEAAEGAVKGSVKGVLELPFVALRKTRRAAAEFAGIEAKVTDRERAEVNAVAHELLSGAAMEGDERAWGSRGANRGTVRLERVYESDGQPCRTLGFEFMLRDGYRQHTVAEVCRDEHGEWTVKDAKTTKR